jgi:hypothetical protein
MRRDTYYKTLADDDARKAAEAAKPCAVCGLTIPEGEAWRVGRRRLHFRCMPAENQRSARELFPARAPAEPIWNPRWSD